MRAFFSDYVVMESTYGGINRKEGHHLESRLSVLRNHLINTVVKKGGVLLIPAFALGRMQEVLFDLHQVMAGEPETFGSVPLYVQSGMGLAAGDAYVEALRRTDQLRKGEVKHLWLSDETFRRVGLSPERPGDADIMSAMMARAFGGEAAQTKWERFFPSGPGLSPVLANWCRVRRPMPEVRPGEFKIHGPAVLVIGGGMCESPAFGHHCGLLRSPTTTLLATGFLSKSSIGHQLMELADLDRDNRALLSDSVVFKNQKGNTVAELKLADVEADLCTMSTYYSAHADQKGLLDWLRWEFNGSSYMAAPTAFLTHGQDHSRNALGAAIKERELAFSEKFPDQNVSVHFEVPSPKAGWYDLDSGCWCAADVQNQADQEGPDANALEAEIQLLREEIAHLRSLRANPKTQDTVRVSTEVLNGRPTK